MFRILAAALAAFVMATPALAQVVPFAQAFHTQEISTNGTTIHVRVGGKGPAVTLLHGYGETGDMWARSPTTWSGPHRGRPRPARHGAVHQAPGGFDKKNQGKDVSGVLDALKVGKTDLVTHDIGNMVGYAFAARTATG
jgi:pimeloyl-ACP methyl ester carboxylesterase